MAHQPLQRTGLEDSQYERPQQKWVCGWASHGKPCRAGPDSGGECGANFECLPSQRGERWHCARQPLQGGRCEDGPLPDGTCCLAVIRCRPTLSWRARRANMSRWALFLTFGLLVVGLAGSGPAAISPGPLNAKHSTAARQCTTCHLSGDDDFSAWVATAFAGADGVAESQRCTRCHDRGEHALRAHSLSGPDLERLTERARTIETASAQPMRMMPWVGDLEQLRTRDLSCSTCHTEHRGSDFDLKAMRDEHCQSCHLNQFSSFAADHPEFVSFPYDRRTRIAFDHVSHLAQHFPKKEELFDCNNCHEPHAAGRQMLVRDYLPTCASCHEKQIIDEPQSVFVVPILDLAGLEERETDIGEWPEDGSDGLSPYIRLLLSGDPEVRKALISVDEIEDLEDLADEDTVSDEQLEAVAIVAWAIKTLLRDLSLSGHQGLAWYLGRTLQGGLSKRTLSALSSGLPRDTLTRMVETWFPQLDDELEAHLSGRRVPTIAMRSKEPSAPSSLRPASGLLKVAHSGSGDYWSRYIDPQAKQDAPEEPPEEAGSEEEWPSAGGWYYSEDDYGLLYRIRGHRDPFTQGWLEVAARMRQTEPGAFELLADVEAPGRCLKCHSIDADSSGDLTLNWSPFRATRTQEVTRFSHRAHFSLGDQQGCQTCHSLDPGAEFQAGYADYDPNDFTSNFKPMTIGTCRQCHNPKQAGSDCLTCHTYHVGSFQPTLITVQQR